MVSWCVLNHPQAKTLLRIEEERVGKNLLFEVRNNVVF